MPRRTKVPHRPVLPDPKYNNKNITRMISRLMLDGKRSLAERTELTRYLKARDIHAVFHYVPLHLSQMGATYGGRKGQCPVTEDISDRLLRLPFYNVLSRAEQDRVIEAISAFYDR